MTETVKFQPLPAASSRLLELLEAAAKRWCANSALALLALDEAEAEEASGILCQNVASIKAAAVGVPAAQRVTVYAVLLRDALREWSEHGADHPQVPV